MKRLSMKQPCPDYPRSPNVRGLTMSHKMRWPNDQTNCSQVSGNITIHAPSRCGSHAVYGIHKTSYLCGLSHRMCSDSMSCMM